MRRKSVCRFCIILEIAVIVLILGACDGGERQAGIEVGNPVVTMSAQFQLAEGNPEPLHLLKRSSSNRYSVSLANDEMFWEQLLFPLQEVRYYGSFYFYNPGDPEEGLRLWPELAQDTLLLLDILDGDTLVADFEQMDIPSRSYLKQVELILNMSHWQFKGQWCSELQSCRHVRITLPDSLTYKIQYHHSQLLQQESTGNFELPVNFYPEIWLSQLSMNDQICPDKDSCILEPGRQDSVLNLLIHSFAQSFNSLSYILVQGQDTLETVFQQHAVNALDQIGVERVVNGNFHERGLHWTFLNQFGGRADTLFTNDTMTFDITKEGTEVYSVQFLQEDIELVEGRTYHLTFKAWADSATPIIARVGRFHTPYDNLDVDDQDFRVILGFEPKEWIYPFVAKETTPFGRLEFNLGGYQRQVKLSHVRLVQMD